MSERRRFQSGSPYEPEYGFSRAIRVGDRVLIAGTAPIPHPGEEVADTAYRQMLRCGQIIVSALEEAGSTPADVIRTRMYLTDAADADEVGRAHREVFGAAAPAATMVVVAALIDPTWKVEVEVEAAVG
ncbi:MAG TPA: RidA family protein [Acidimicrobiia bacterium]|nr:RidA family protein [Acidimicrobiia bacterium]